ncbi:hypothetical protein K4A83_13530 [Spirulina subsalsa FACHB-351]|uniref:Tetratricopeptide repeat protein n=1 Tax=Spirulina subsalsa FACHB-351 TaxID=234711 RepID=A0ABT3L858_9CYAN|nr:hypothetical protein [Spirulina subsalsa]MCW6037284.1 hypothetical protein [Spirulina subsalsa FACHB-351]
MGAIIGLQRPRLTTLLQPVTELDRARVEQEVQRETLYLALIRQLPSLGFDNLWANWVFLRYLQYFGDDEARAITDHSLVLPYFEIILDRDPRFRDAYSFLATGGSIFAAQPQEANDLMEEAFQYVQPRAPYRAYYILRHKAINQLLFLGDGETARRSYELAAQWATDYYSDPESQNVAELSREMADFLRKNPASPTAQISAWLIILGTVQDDRTRQIALDQIQALGGRIELSPEGQIRVLPPSE